jgi:hypothetical protein
MVRIYAIIFALLIIACTPTEQAELKTAAENLQETAEDLQQIVESTPALKEFAETAADPQLGAAECTEPIDPQIMLDVFPAQVGSYVAVGETIAERSEIPGYSKDSLALRTLTIEDETYLSFTGNDGCGANMNVAKMKLMYTRDDEYGWTRETTVAGRPAWISYDVGIERYTVNVLLGDRVLIEIVGDLTSEETTMDAASQVDYDAIEAALS